MNPNLRPELKLMHLLRTQRHYHHKSRRKRRSALEVTASLWENRFAEFKYDFRFLNGSRNMVGRNFRVVQEIAVDESISDDKFSTGSTVESMYLMCMRRHYRHVWNTRHWTDSEFAWTLSCFEQCLSRKFDVTTGTLGWQPNCYISHLTNHCPSVLALLNVRHVGYKTSAYYNCGSFRENVCNISKNVKSHVFWIFKKT